MRPTRDAAHAGRTPTLLLTLAAAAFLSAPAPPAQAAAAGAGGSTDPAETLVLAHVNGEPITLAAVRDAFGSRHSGHASLLVGEEIIRKVVEKAVEERLLIQEGRRMGIPDEPGFKEAVGVYRDTLLLEQFEARHLREASAPAPAEVRAAYDLLPRRLHLAVIQTKDAATLDQVKLRLAAGEPFETVARQSSTHQSRTRGGDLGWVSWGGLDEDTERVAIQAPVGSLSAPFAVPEGWRLVKVLEESRGEPPAFEEVADRIGAIIKSRRESKVRSELLASIRRTSPPMEDAAAIGKLAGSKPDEAPGKAEPPDAAVLMKTAGGLSVTAGHVRYRAGKAGLSPSAAYRAAAEDALLIDEARRRIKPDAALNRKVAAFADARIRDELERGVILKDLALTDEAVRAYYEKNPAAFARGASYHMRHIVLAGQAEAEALLARLRAGGDFATLARQHSIDKATSDKAGDIGWLDGPTGVVPDGLFAMKPGEYSGVVRTSLGYSIVQMLEIKTSPVPSFEKVRHDAAQRLMIDKQRELRDAFVGRLRKVATVQVHAAAVQRAIRVQDQHVGGRLTTGQGGRQGGSR